MHESNLMTEEDLRYIRMHFVPLAEACKSRQETLRSVSDRIYARKLPRPTYVLPDGTEMVPASYWVMPDEAGGEDKLEMHFNARYRVAAEARGHTPNASEVHQEWQSYLSGEYGACLVTVTPENIFEKEWLVKHLTQRLAAPLPEDPEWCLRLKQEVERLDRLVRDFAPWDRIRFGGPVSRDRLITATRQRYSHIFLPSQTRNDREHTCDSIRISPLSRL